MNDGTCPPPPSSTQFSLTNWIELVIINDIHEHAKVRNQFDMVRQTTPPRTVQGAFCPRNAFPGSYTPYIVTEIKSDRLKITPVDYKDELQNKSIYFYVNNSINRDRRYLEVRLFEVWRTRAGTNKFGSVYSPSTPNRFPYQMPSRYVTFR